MKGEYNTIMEAGGEVVAVSVDSLESHARFAQAMGGCPFPLVSDESLDAARLYGVVGEDGRRHLFVFDDNEQLQNLKRAYYFNQAQVDPLSFKRSIRELKSLIMGG